MSAHPLGNPPWHANARRGQWAKRLRALLAGRPAAGAGGWPDGAAETVEGDDQLRDGVAWVGDPAYPSRYPISISQDRLEVPRPCVVYSVGINDDTSFDEAVVSRNACEVYASAPPAIADP